MFKTVQGLNVNYIHVIWFFDICVIDDHTENRYFRKTSIDIHVR